MADNLEVTLAELRRDVVHIRATVDRLEEKSVTRREFEPVRKLVYGTVGLVLVAFLSALAVTVWP